jgi:hypothetical protein
MAILTREAILEKDDLKKEVVSVPEWGGDVIIASMTGAMRDAWEQSLIADKSNMDNIRAKLLLATAVDEGGNSLFAKDDLVALGRKSSAALDRCIKVAQRLNRLTQTDLDDLAKN